MTPRHPPRRRRPLALAWGAAVLALATAAPALAQTYFDPSMTLWGPGRKASGDLFRSMADAPTPADGPFRWTWKDASFAVGGQYFARMISSDNADFNAAKKDSDTFFEHRARLSLRASLGGTLGFLLEYQDVRLWGSERSPASLEPLTGLHQGFVDVRPTPWLNLRVGRQELSYGDDRLLGTLDWGMAARAFDGALVRLSGGTVTLDAFGMLVRERAVTAATGTAPQFTNEGAQLYGLYGRWRPDARLGLDVYALGYVADPTTADSGPRGERGFTTLGARGFVTGQGLLVTVEGAYQLGTDPRGGGDLRAYGLAGKLVYTLPVWGAPYLGFEYLRGSGDGDPADGTSNTFHQLFPTGHLYLGYADYAGWQNVQGYRATAGLRPGKGHVWVDVHRLELLEAKGTWYNAAGNAFIAADPLRTHLVMGTEIDVSVTWPLHPNAWLAGGYGVFLPGDAARAAPGSTTGRGSDTSHWGFVSLRSLF